MLLIIPVKKRMLLIIQVKSRITQDIQVKIRIIQIIQVKRRIIQIIQGKSRITLMNIEIMWKNVLMETVTCVDCPIVNKRTNSALLPPILWLNFRF